MLLLFCVELSQPSFVSACEKVAADVIPYFLDDDQFFRRFFRDHPERVPLKIHNASIHILVTYCQLDNWMVFSFSS